MRSEHSFSFCAAHALLDSVQLLLQGKTRSSIAQLRRFLDYNIEPGEIEPAEWLGEEGKDWLKCLGTSVHATLRKKATAPNLSKKDKALLQMLTRHLPAK